MEGTNTNGVMTYNDFIGRAAIKYEVDRDREERDGGSEDPVEVDVEDVSEKIKTLGITDGQRIRHFSFRFVE